MRETLENVLSHIENEIVTHYLLYGKDPLKIEISLKDAKVILKTLSCLLNNKKLN